MKGEYPRLGLGRICKMFGMTRQAYYEHENRRAKQEIQEEMVLMMIQHFRKIMPKVGARKLYHLIYPELQMENIKLGRDLFFDLLRKHGLLNKPRRYRAQTTDSSHGWRRYKNLITDFVPKTANELWVSDITYIRMEKGFTYLSLITDGFSRKILGWNLSNSLCASGAMEALEMATRSLLPKEKRPQLIHHSDRGVQYFSKGYVDLLKKEGANISMTENGDPRENAIAERINGTIKNEFYLSDFGSFEEAKKRVAEAIFIYNTIRPHLSLNYLTPELAHGLNEKPKKVWKNYYPKKNKNKDFKSKIEHSLETVQ